MEQSKAAMWYDATVAAATIDAAGSPIVGNVGFAPAPVDKTAASGWLWSWALALEGASKNRQEAWAFMDWATSKSYIAYDAAQNGWAAGPPGTRTSTYQNPSYQAAAKDFAALTLSHINSVNVNQPGAAPQPVPGVQYVGIPEFEDFTRKCPLKSRRQSMARSPSRQHCRRVKRSPSKRSSPLVTRVRNGSEE